MRRDSSFLVAHSAGDHLRRRSDRDASAGLHPAIPKRHLVFSSSFRELHPSSSVPRSRSSSASLSTSPSKGLTTYQPPTTRPVQLQQTAVEYLFRLNRRHNEVIAALLLALTKHRQCARVFILWTTARPSYAHEQPHYDGEDAPDSRTKTGKQLYHSAAYKAAAATVRLHQEQYMHHQMAADAAATLESKNITAIKQRCYRMWLAYVQHHAPAARYRRRCAAALLRRNTQLFARRFLTRWLILVTTAAVHTRRLLRQPQHLFDSSTMPSAQPLSLRSTAFQTYLAHRAFHRWRRWLRRRTKPSATAIATLRNAQTLRHMQRAFDTWRLARSYRQSTASVGSLTHYRDTSATLLASTTAIKLRHATLVRWRDVLTQRKQHTATHRRLALLRTSAITAFCRSYFTKWRDATLHIKRLHEQQHDDVRQRRFHHIAASMLQETAHVRHIRTVYKQWLAFRTTQQGKRELLATALAAMCRHTTAAQTRHAFRQWTAYLGVRRIRRVQQQVAHTLVTGSSRALQLSTLTRWMELVRMRRMRRRKSDMLGVMASRTERGQLATAYRRWRMLAAVRAERSRHRASAHVAAYHLAVRNTESARIRMALATWMRFTRVRRLQANQRAKAATARLMLQSTQRGQTLVAFKRWALFRTTQQLHQTAKSVAAHERTACSRRLAGHMVSTDVRATRRNCFVAWLRFAEMRNVASIEVRQRLLWMKRECRMRLCSNYLRRWMKAVVVAYRQKYQDADGRCNELVRRNQSWQSVSYRIVTHEGAESTLWRRSVKRCSGRTQVEEASAVEPIAEFTPERLLNAYGDILSRRDEVIARLRKTGLTALRTINALHHSAAELRALVKASAVSIAEEINGWMTVAERAVGSAIASDRAERMAELTALRRDASVRIHDLEEDVEGREEAVSMCQLLLVELDEMRATHHALSQRLHDRDTELDHARMQLLMARVSFERYQVEHPASSATSWDDLSAGTSLVPATRIGASAYHETVCRVVARLLQAMSSLDEDAYECNGNAIRVESDALTAFVKLVRRQYTELAAAATNEGSSPVVARVGHGRRERSLY